MNDVLFNKALRDMNLHYNDFINHYTDYQICIEVEINEGGRLC